MTIPGDHWPIFLYAGYDYDADDPWKGLFRSPLLVAVLGDILHLPALKHLLTPVTGIQTRFHIP